ncbi:hypothetical protein AALA73_08745 [Parasutterella excrementihominis]|uniref:hypothetical protein n=1 Tax=Parasutterella excrementihominis TaxID=487175 RepID=UPI0035178705
MKRLIISMFLLLYLSGCTASAEYVIGIGTGAMAASQKLFFEETAKYLEKEFGARTIELKGPIALGELKEIIRTKQIDYFISSAGFEFSHARERCSHRCERLKNLVVH